jgi:hypothetical protein
MHLPIRCLIVLVIVGCSPPRRPPPDAGPNRDGGPRHFDTGVDPARDAGRAVPRDAYIGNLGGDVWEGWIESYASLGYPVGLDLDDMRALMPAEGFGYPIENGSIEGNRIVLTLNELGLWEPWCELQTPVPLGNGQVGWGCLPVGDTAQGPSECVITPPDGPMLTVDCTRLRLCSSVNVCACTADGCVVRERGVIAIDLQISDAHADGTISIGGPRPAHLVR